MTPNMYFPMVDVSNVAQAHLNGILKPEAAGQRCMLVGHTINFIELG